MTMPGWLRSIEFAVDLSFVNAKGWFLDLLGKFLPGWIVVLTSIVISGVVILCMGPIIMMYLTLLERKLIGRIQNRYGPNRVGIWGLLQPIADGIKMFTKEDIVPANADKLIHLLAPIVIVIPALMVFLVVPFGERMTAANLNIGILYFIAVSSITTIPIFMGSWASRNKYSLLGGMRTAAQMISYEIPMTLSVVPVIMMSQSLSTNTIVMTQCGDVDLHWFVFTPWGLTGFMIFFLCAVAECNRPPFDLPEAESELVAGFHTEYSGMKFALFYMAEYMNAFTLCGIATTLFLGGWQGPFLPSWLWFFGKTFLLICVMIWFRGTFPRFRVDQLMGFAWKFLLPLTLINILVAGLWQFVPERTAWLYSVPILIVSLWTLVKLNRHFVPEKRAYPLAD
ncbi:MAG TPA: NADH-quinone oxidoreductase subunit NuoH [Candidatus Omnitrophota bacterium]|nr:NADH-quinone oxidoreductase subunit NuoH [Candidatus Omnitrophota bacterium]HPS37253.1 NADH-quinone oxidoreductase subunit NuoH [Candidatus Omnitrophota bacterium]